MYPPFDLNHYMSCNESAQDDMQPVASDRVLREWTGLHDKNGTEIYESDIIKVWDDNRGCEGCADGGNEEGKHDTPDCENYLCTQEVKWAGGWFCSEDTGEYCPPLSDDYFEFEVIGNIYQNPELLKQK